jgi:hypothetical protein
MKICELNDIAIHEIVSQELQLHPMLEPTDLFKLLYQALYGPFHIVRDFKQLCDGISKELWIMKHAYAPLFQEIGHCYTRISLSAIKRDGDKDKVNTRVECLARWILDSCVLYEDVREDFNARWIHWRHILHSALPGKPEAWNKADEIAAKGLIPSHSQVFHDMYHPHYRLVDINLKQHHELFLEINR